MRVKEAVSDPQWQALRGSLAGKWTATPDDNIARLKTYLGEAPSDQQIIQVFNLLCACRSVYAKHPQVREFMEEMSRLKQSRKVKIERSK